MKKIANFNITKLLNRSKKGLFFHNFITVKTTHLVQPKVKSNLNLSNLTKYDKR